MTDATLSLPTLGESLTTVNSRGLRKGDLLMTKVQGRARFGAVRYIERDKQDGHITLQDGVYGRIPHYTFIGRPDRDGWLKFTGERNPLGDAVVEARLATGAVMIRRADHFPEAAWRAVITEIRPYTPPPIPSVTTVQQAIEALKPFAEVARCYDDAEDDHHEVWTDHGAIGGPARSAFRLEKFRAAAAALEVLMGKKQEQS